MGDVGDFGIKFGPAAWTITYEDPLGALTFVFDVRPLVGTNPQKWILKFDGRSAFLGAAAVTRQQNRIEIAVQRVERYATECGYKVEKR